MKIIKDREEGEERRRRVEGDGRGGQEGTRGGGEEGRYT